MCTLGLGRDYYLYFRPFSSKKKKKVLEERFHFAHDCVFVKVLISEQMFKAPKAAITFCEYIYCLNHTELLLVVVG